MAIYWGDYRQNTGHFNCTEHGAYLMMMAHYWENGPMQENADLYKRLYSICSCASEVEKRAVHYVLKAMFTLKRSRWTHARLDQEMKKADEKTRQRSACGKMGGRPQKQKLSNWKPKENQSQSQSQLPSSKEGDRLRRSPTQKPCPYCKQGITQTQQCCTNPVCIDNYKKDFLAREKKARQRTGQR